MKRILLIEDSTDFQELVKKSLGPDYLVHTISTFEEALTSSFPTDFDLILLDLMLPDGDGFKLFTRFKNNDQLNKVPIIFLSARNTEDDLIMGFSLGADDYITKPINPRVFKAKIQALIEKKTRHQEDSKILKRNNLMFDLSSQQAYLIEQGKKHLLDLTPIEYRILLKLAESPTQVYTREQLINIVWGDNVFVNDRCVDNHISKLRRKLDNQFIKSIRSKGYTFSKAA